MILESVKLKVDPFPGSDCNSIPPPNKVTNLLEIDKPSPVP